MGQEIATSRFTQQDFTAFGKKLAEETSLLERYFREGSFSRDHGVGGFELEAWIVDADLRPAPINERYLARLGDPLVGAELALFNIELNCQPRRLHKDALGVMRADLERLWRACWNTARELDSYLLMIGTLPTVVDDELVPHNMSRLNRYRALNDQVMALRSGAPFRVDIEGRDRLRIEHESVMLEAACTAFQVQLQVDFERSVRFYNAAVILSAPMVAATANSPYLFGRELWNETRITLFEQSLAGVQTGPDCPDNPGRVTLGRAYANRSLFEIFAENRDCYHTLLPMVSPGADPDEFSHLRLHNGAIWRWNRPLIGFSEDGGRHLRIEHRVAPSGPTIVDTVANAAFFFGLAQALGSAPSPPESALPFGAARDNFYRAAREGLDARIVWLDGAEVETRALILTELLPAAREGLADLGVDADEADYFLDVVKNRAASGQTGSVWQRSYRERRRCGMRELCEAYLERQESGAPVSDWPL